MSKERLEEIVEKISEQTFDRIIVPQTKITIEYQDIKFLINAITKQTERVQELEDLVEDYITINKELHKRGKKVRKQNKRYRETIENIRQTSTDFRNGHLLDIQDSFFVDEIIAIINKLEESE